MLGLKIYIKLKLRNAGVNRTSQHATNPMTTFNMCMHTSRSPNRSPSIVCSKNGSNAKINLSTFRTFETFGTEIYITSSSSSQCHLPCPFSIAQSPCRVHGSADIFYTQYVPHYPVVFCTLRRRGALVYVFCSS